MNSLCVCVFLGTLCVCSCACIYLWRSEDSIQYSSLEATHLGFPSPTSIGLEIISLVRWGSFSRSFDPDPPVLGLNTCIMVSDFVIWVLGFTYGS